LPAASRSTTQTLVDLLTLERLEDRLFRGQCLDIGSGSVFGGQVLGQALAAAQATVDSARPAHSLHAYFLRAGDVNQPIIYEVDCTRDGGSFSVRRVSAIQHGRVIFFCATSFQRTQTGLEHHVPMPDVPMPDSLEARPPLPPEILQRLSIKVQRWLSRGSPVEFRQINPRDELNPGQRAPCHQVWLRLSEPIASHPPLHRALLAYISDFYLLGTVLFPHGLSYYQRQVRLASLDHALWFHRDFSVNQWLLYSLDSPTTQSGRGLARGQFFNQEGQLVASSSQEGMVRINNSFNLGRAVSSTAS